MMFTPKSHQGIKTKFSELFIKTGLFPMTVSDYLQNAFALRQEADYDLDANITADEAALVLGNAEALISLTRQYLDETQAGLETPNSLT